MTAAYVVRFDGTVSTGPKTLIQVRASSSRPIEVLRARCTNKNSETSQQVVVQLVRKNVLATVTEFTPIKYNTSDPAAASGTVGSPAETGVNASSEGSTSEVIVSEGVNLLAGFHYLPTPEERIYVPAGGAVAMVIPDTIDSTAILAELVYRELP